MSTGRTEHARGTFRRAPDRTGTGRVPAMTYVKGCLAALKPHIQPSIMAPVVVGATVAAGRLPAGREWLVPLGIGVFYSGAVSALNDVFDLPRDIHNHPGRLLARRAMTLPAYLCLLVALPTAAGLGLLGAGLTGTPGALPRLLLLLAVIEAMHLAYGLIPNLGLRGFVRQALLTVGPMLLVLCGWAAGDEPFSVALVLTALAVGLFFGSGIITKDILDVAGDSSAGLVTLPGSYGVRAAAWMSAVGHLLAFVAVLDMARRHLLTASAGPWLLVAAVASAACCGYWIRGRPSRYWGVPMVIGYLSQFVFETGLVVGTYA